MNLKTEDRPASGTGGSDGGRCVRKHAGRLLRLARLSQGWTLKELGAEVKMSIGALSKIEHGSQAIDLELFALLCEVLKLPAGPTLDKALTMAGRPKIVQEFDETYDKLMMQLHKRAYPE